MRDYPETRNASPQAWRRLRKSLTAGEMRDIAKDLAAIVTVESGDTTEMIERSILFGLTAYAWEAKKQA